MTLNYATAIYVLDDSNLDVYQARVWIRILRRGVCFESQRSMADGMSMSLGTVNKTIKWLLDNGWIVRSVDEKTQKAGYSSVIPDEQVQQNSLYDVNNVLPDERRVLPDERHLKAKEIKQKDTAAAREDEKRNDSAFTFYENNIGGMSPRISSWIKEAIKEHGESVVIDAMDEAVQSNVRRWKYIQAILKNWKENGRIKPSPANGFSSNGNGRVSKNELKDNLWAIVTKSKDYPEAMGRASPDESKLLKAMGKWRDVRALNETKFNIRFYEVYNAGN